MFVFYIENIVNGITSRKAVNPTMTSNLLPPVEGVRAFWVIRCQSVATATARQHGALVDLWVAEVFASELGFGSKLLLNPVNQRSWLTLLFCLKV